MNKDLLLHPGSKLQIDYFLDSPSHALLLAGPAGSGKKTIAKTIAAKLLNVDIKKLDSYPYFIQVVRLKSKQDIAIEQVREVISALKLKVPGNKNVQRVIFVEDAHYLSVPAQNALLKVLEEPAAGTVFLLSVNSVKNVLPTIASRAQALGIQPVNLNAAKDFWNNQYDPAQIESSWRLSGGSVGLLCALLSEEKNHPLKESVQQARKFLSSKPYERLLILDTLSRNKDQFGLFADALARILSFLHHSAISNNKTKQAQNILESRKTLQKTQVALKSNVNSKIITLELVQGLKI
jgi:hypothetical protein